MAQSNCQYVPAPALEQLFRDKDTGLPLSAGIIEFFSDCDRITQKPVYEQTGVPGNYTYIELPNPLILTQAGSFPTVVYYHPYNAEGEVELYYIVIRNSEGVLQRTVEGYPSVCDTDDGGQTLPANNYWQNPQFRMRLDPPPGGTLPGELVDPVTALGYGGYNFTLPANFTSTNIISFETFTQTITDPEAHPPAVIIISCTNPVPAETFKDFRKEFFDVNFLAGTEVTLQFDALTNSGPIDADIVVIDNYGPGGSSTLETIVATVVISTNTLTTQAFTFTMPDNAGATISNNVFDSSVFICLRFPTSVLFEVGFTNFFLQPGAFEVIPFPNYSLSQDVSLTLGGSLPVPNPDGSDEGKIVRLAVTPRSASNYNYPSLIYSNALSDGANLIYGGNFTTNPWQRSIDTDDYDPYIFPIDNTVDKIYTADRFQFVSPAGDPGREFEGQVERVADFPTLSQCGVYLEYSLQITTTTGQSTILDSPYYLEYVVEGYDFQSIAQQPINLAFWIKATVPGIYSISFSNSGSDSVIVEEYQIFQSLSWEYKTIQIPASIIAGDWNYLTGAGLNIRFNQTPVTTPASTVGSWVNPAVPTDYVSANQVNALENIGNIISFNLVQLLNGSSPLSFIEPNFPVLMNKLQRYFQKSSRDDEIANNQNTRDETFTFPFSANSLPGRVTVHYFPTKLRDTPLGSSINQISNK